MSYTKRNSRVVAFHAFTTFDGLDNPVSVQVNTQIQTTVVNDQNPAEIANLPDKGVSFDLLAAPTSTNTYTAAGKTVTGIQLAALIRQAVLDEATRQNI